MSLRRSSEYEQTESLIVCRRNDKQQNTITYLPCIILYSPPPLEQVFQPRNVRHLGGSNRNCLNASRARFAVNCSLKQKMLVTSVVLPSLPRPSRRNFATLCVTNDLSTFAPWSFSSHFYA